MISQYIAPEYLTDGVVSTMNDVYALGITLLETVSGIRRRSRQPREFQLRQWVCVHMHHNMDLYYCFSQAYLRNSTETIYLRVKFELEQKLFNEGGKSSYCK